ncbi:MAG: Penicillin-binding protein, 1A family [Microgenomates group bacterium GW2011_GWA2_46_16]|nr:MAG: Penicillin-binding protein, 1A family [Microgenomates group bacterium GW2011_GWA2_46_16]
MAKRAKKSSNLVLQSLELIGKPIFLLFTLVVLFCFTLLQLITKLLHSIKVLSSRARREILSRFLRFDRNDKKQRDARRTLLKRNSRLQVEKDPTAVGRRVLKGSPKINLKFIIVMLVCLLIGTSVYWYILRDLPSPRLLTDSPPSLTTKIYDRHGTLLYQIYKDENRTLIQLSILPKHVIDATLAAEDKDFYSHHGVSFTGILRAATNNLTKGTTQGGSTITQQLVKNVLLSPKKTFTRKIKELILALETESMYSKDQILQMYLNQVGYGGTAYGIEQASRQYFGKPATNLSLAESAMLAGLPISPTLLSPFGTTPYLGKIRQQQVLEAMVAGNLITENDKLAALATPLVFHPQDIEIRAPHFVMYVKDLLVKEYGEATIARGGLSVTTTLDLNYQNILQQEINTELSHLTNLHVQNGAGLILSPGTGEILAMVGSRDFFDSQHDGQVNVVLQPRQPGSSIKPITYALAFSRGATPNSPIDDSPICFIVAGQPNYCPKNYDGKFHGRVTLRTALGSSYNIPAIKLLNTHGLDNMINLARQLGITTWEDPSRFGLSLTLGGGEITMLDLASVYSVFANGGIKVPVSPILSVLDPRGVSLTGDLAKGQVGTPKVEGDSPQYLQVIPESIAFQINSILSDSAARAPAFGVNSILNLPGNGVAVKTGTTNNLRDNWTFGYTKDILVATWVGNNDNTPMSSVASGITGASPIWARTMKRLLQDYSTVGFQPPTSLVKINVSCSSPPRYEYFIPGTAPKKDCSSPPPGSLLDFATATSQ